METPREDGIDRSNAVTIGERIDQCDRLPDELLLNLIGYLPLQDIITCERVSKIWRQASKRCMEDDIREFKKDDPLYAPGGIFQTEIQQQAPEIHFSRRHLMRTGNARKFLELSSSLLAFSGEDVVYMPLDNVEKKRLKCYIPHEMKYWTGGEMAACLLGKSSVYAAQPPDGDGRCHLGAYDSESGSELWRSEKSYSWKQNDRSLFNVWRRRPDKIRPRVIQTGHGKEHKELILCPKEEHDQIDIIRGSSGRHLQSIEHPGRGIGAVLTHPISKKVAIVEELRSNQFSPPHAAVLGEHRIGAIRHFHNEPETGLSPYHTDMLIIPRVHSSWGQVPSDGPPPIAIDPFYMTAVGPDRLNHPTAATGWFKHSKS
ncbi:hypothetical protein BDV19DRAFT_384643 [Aspergillus venezuelensis]